MTVTVTVTVMGLMQSSRCLNIGGEEPSSSSSSILHVPVDQPYRQGTVFHVLDVQRLCTILMRAYMLLSTDACSIQDDADQITSFLEGAIPAMNRRGSSASLCGIPSRKCRAWLALKNSLKRANIQPLALVLRNAGKAQPNEKLKRIDWYMRKEWFITHSVSSTSSRNSHRASAKDGKEAEKYAARSFMDWGTCAEENDCNEHAGMLLGDVSAFRSKAESMRTEKQQEDFSRKAKRTSNPYDAHVVEAVKRAMKHV